MRLISLVVAAIAAMTVFAGSSVTAQAFGWEREHRPHGYGHVQVVTRHVYRPRYRHVYRLHSWADPYRYEYRESKYYPYYGAGYWRPRSAVRHSYHFRQPSYAPAWGYGPKRVRHPETWIWHTEKSYRHHRRHHGH